MMGFRVCRTLLALAVFINPNVTLGQSRDSVAEKTTAARPIGCAILLLPANAEQIANAIGIMRLVQRVRLLDSECNESGSFSVEELALRQQIVEAVLTTSLDVNGVSAEINYERAQILEIQELLSGGRDRGMNLVALGNIVGSAAVGSVGSALAISNSTSTAGNIVSAVGGATGVILTTFGLRQRGAVRSLGIATNMLAPIFGRSPELRSVYPRDVWIYLNTAPATDPQVHVPWKDQLISEWTRLGRIGQPDALGSQKKIDQLTSTIPEHKALSPSLLADRSAMLADLDARVALMNRDLRDLLKAVSISPAP